MLYKFDRKRFREIINGSGDRRDSFVNIITLKILMLQKKVFNEKDGKLNSV